MKMASSFLIIIIKITISLEQLRLKKANVHNVRFLSVMASLTSASSATSTQPIMGLFLNSVITEFLFNLLWVLAPYAGS